MTESATGGGVFTYAVLDVLEHGKADSSWLGLTRASRLGKLGWSIWKRAAGTRAVVPHSGHRHRGRWQASDRQQGERLVLAGRLPENDFAARITWTLTSDYAAATRNPAAVLNGVPGRAPINLAGCAGDVIKLSAAGTRDPDGNHRKYWSSQDLVDTHLRAASQRFQTPPDSPRRDACDGVSDCRTTRCSRKYQLWPDPGSCRFAF